MRRWWVVGRTGGLLLGGFSGPSIGLRFQRFHVDIHDIFEARHDVWRAQIGNDDGGSLIALHSLTGIDLIWGQNLSAEVIEVGEARSLVTREGDGGTGSFRVHLFLKMSLELTCCYCESPQTLAQ
jgi:hypothetical protein